MVVQNVGVVLSFVGLNCVLMDLCCDFELVIIVGCVCFWCYVMIGIVGFQDIGVECKDVSGQNGGFEKGIGVFWSIGKQEVVYILKG